MSNEHGELHTLTGGEPACAGAVDSDLWFPIRHKDRSRKQFNLAKAVCDTCGVKQACLEYALEYFDLDGIWGGTDLPQRIEIQRTQKIVTRSVISVIPFSKPHPRGVINEYEEHA
jgi:WhiB family redox-sensing transcriptional regulator